MYVHCSTEVRSKAHGSVFASVGTEVSRMKKKKKKKKKIDSPLPRHICT